MPERKHNMFAIKLVGLAVSVVSVVIGVITVPWQGVVKFGHSVNFLYDNVEEIEHILDDYHELLPIRDEVDSMKRVLFETRSRDSLIHVIELLNRGKYPYDSIWHLGPSGYRYETTIEKHFREEHDN